MQGEKFIKDLIIGLTFNYIRCSITVQGRKRDMKLSGGQLAGGNSTSEKQKMISMQQTQKQWTYLWKGH